MGMLGSDTCPPPPLILHLLLLLSPCPGILGGQTLQRQINANFAYRFIEDVYFPKRESKNLTSPWNLPPDALNVFTIPVGNKPCVQINVSINASGLPNLRGFDVQLLEFSNNENHNFRILKKRYSTVGDLWKFQFQCWFVNPLQTVQVDLFTIPDYGVTLTKNVSIPDYDEVPEFHYQHFAEEKRILVSIPHSQNAFARLCSRFNAQNKICDDLKTSVMQLLNSSYNVSLPYETLLPCLCIEVFYDIPNSRRNQTCPFVEQAVPYLRDLMKMSVKEIKFPDKAVTVLYQSPCLLWPNVSLCRKQNGSCVPDSDANIEIYEDEQSQKYVIKNIDSDPNLCFQFSLKNHTYFKCPGNSDRVWNVDMKLTLFDVLLNISSKVPAAFSGAICYQNQSTDTCSIQSAIYNVSRPHKNQQLSFPKPAFGQCIKVWRTDVRFAHEYLFCSFDYSHKHLGLIALAALLVVFAVTLLIFLTLYRIWKIFTAPLWRRTILLVYSPDSSEYKTLICIFADFLQSVLGCEVILDMWDMNTVSQIGMLPWFYQKRELVSERKGKVMIVWTARTLSMYQQWRSRQVNSFAWKDPANLFGAAMSYLNKDLETKPESGKLKEYSIVYFEGLCDKKDIPKSLKKISRYRLFKDLYRLVSKLQDTTCLSPPCLIKAVVKYLMKKLMPLEKDKGLQYHIELCKQRLHEEARAEKKKMDSTAL